MRAEPLPRERDREAARVLGEALTDDPGWADVGPRDRERRRRMLHRNSRGCVRMARRWGGPLLGVFAGDELAGVCLFFAPGRWPPPPWSLAWAAHGIAQAGPAVWLRALRVQRQMELRHPIEPHLYVFVLGVHPAHQRKGVGRALLAGPVADADRHVLPAWVETGNPDNLPYYGSLGFEPEHKIRLPRGAPMWFMRREPGS